MALSHFLVLCILTLSKNRWIWQLLKMSLEENPKEDSDVAQATVENENKPAKDRKSRKDKVRPLAKVLFGRIHFRCLI